MKIRMLLTLGCAVALAACAGGSRGAAASGKTDNGVAAAAQPAGTTGGSSFAAPAGRVARGPAIGRVRVINTIAVNGAPGPAIDVYDISRPDANTKPLITNLQYGQISEYVTPHAWTPGDTRSDLYVLPAGSKTPSGFLTGGNIDTGFDAGDQLTLALHRTDLGFGIEQFTEGGRHVRPGMSMDPTPPAGQGLLLARDAVSRSSNEPEPVMYLSIDGACPNVGGGAEGRYAVAPGDHTLGVVTSGPGTGLTEQMCAEKTPVATVHTHVDAGQSIDVLVYGPPAALQILAAPVGK